MSVKWTGSRLVAAIAVALLVVGGAATWALWKPFSPRPDEGPVVSQPAARPPVRAPQPDGRIIRIGCRQGACQWARIVERARLASGDDGELRRLTYRPGTSMDDGANRMADPDSTIDWEPSDRSDFAYCSIRRPAYAFPDESVAGAGALIVHHLDLFNLGGYQFASARLYALVCHDRDAEGEVGSALRDLGYRPGTRSEQGQVSSAETLLLP